MKIYRDFNLEAQEEEIALLHPQLGGEPSASVSADASGRHPGDEQVIRLCLPVLPEFEGLAQDEYTQGFWTPDDIRLERRKPSPSRQQRRAPILRLSPWR